MSNTNTSSFHFHSIDFLRAIGAVAVCIFHLTLGFLHEGNPIYTIFEHGHLGVELFFVITGFLIPYSLYRKSYTIRSIGTYLWDRILRIHPAYLGTVAICVLQEFVPILLPVPMYKPFSVQLIDIIGHFFYASPYIGRPWFILLFWTLAIQFQFYVIYGIIHEAVTAKNEMIRILTLSFLITIPFFVGKGTVDYGFGPVDLNNFLPHYNHIFIAGILIFLRTQGLLNNYLYWLFLLIDMYLLYAYRGDTQRPFVLLFASVVIQFIQIKHAIWTFLAEISYSLYLIHLPIGWSFMAYIRDFYGLKDEWILSVALIAATALSIGGAYLYHRYFEEPVTNWAKKFSLT